MLRPILLVVVSLTELAIIGLLAFEPLLEWRISPDRIAHSAGNSFFVDLREYSPTPGYRLKGDSSEHPRQSTLVLLRDGQPLGPPHSVHDSIAKKGGGAFSHWQTGLYLSTPDNADPRSDGHTYVVRATAQLHDDLQKVLIVAAICLALALAYAAAPLLRGRTPALISPIKIVALLLVCLLAPWIWLLPISRETERLALAGNSALLVAYLVGAGAATAGLLVAPFIRSWRIRVPIVLLLMAGFAIDQIMLTVSRQPMTFELMQTFLRERDMAATVLPAYAAAIVSKLGVAAALSLPLLLKPSATVSLPGRYGIVPVAALVAATALIYGTRGRTEAFPGPFAVPAQAAAAALLANSNTVVDRYPVDYARAISSPYKKIVMVVDESVRGDYLGLNNPKYDNTPTLTGAGNVLVNYGVATSASNCSVAARLILRVGLQKHQLPDTREVWRRLPTIWQFAKKAGYQTALIDGWRPLGEFHSYMDAEEARLIDVNRSAMVGPTHSHDLVAATMLIDLLKRPEPMFIYVNKHGIHPDYAHRFPPALEYDPRVDILPTALDENRRRAVANYHKALRWSVDGFFEKLLPELQRDDVILIFTSDHGQALYEGGYDLSHCSLTTDMHRGEVLIPLFVISHSREALAILHPAAKRAFNRASHFEVMPTLLELMGYGPDWVHSNYGPSLFNVPVDRKRGFLMGTFFHPAATWINLE